MKRFISHRTKKTAWKKILCLLLCVWLGACNTNCSGSVSGDFQVSSGENTDTLPLNAKEGVASRPPGVSPLGACIDGERALQHVKQLVFFAPRHVGTPGIEKTRAYIADQLTSLGLTPVRQRFTAHTPHPTISEVEMENISVRFDGTQKGAKRVIFSGHFDGKIIEKGTFFGANDGGSSTGLLLEMARCLSAHPPASPVELVFFDGEEALVKWSDSDSLYGSKHFVLKLVESGEHRQIAALVNLDMVGDARLAVVQEQHSTPWVFEALRQSAVRLGYGDVFEGPRAAMSDDHTPFLQMKIPAADLIDFNYGPGWDSNAYWHTEKDDMSHISAESLQTVGEIVLTALPTLAAGE